MGMFHILTRPIERCLAIYARQVGGGTGGFTQDLLKGGIKRSLDPSLARLARERIVGARRNTRRIWIRKCPGCRSQNLQQYRKNQEAA